MGRLLDYFTNKWPYTDFHELNADWLISTARELVEIMDTFVVNNTIKYADPLEWDITKQYEKNTVVLDPESNIAYLSVDAVPSGIGIDNTNYWTPIFDLSVVISGIEQMLDDIRNSISINNEGDNTNTSKAYSINDWLWWHDKLYICTSDIAIGVSIREGVNVRLCNVENENQIIYNNADRSLRLHAYIDPNTPIPVSGDYHVYQPTREAIQILKV